MKKISFLLLILNVGFLSAQIDTKLLQKDWFITNILMKDGSKPFQKKESFMQNFGLRVENDFYKLDEVNSLHIKSKIPMYYFLRDHLLETSPESGMLIEKLTSDSLIISQKIDNMEEHQLMRYYMIPLSKARSQRMALFKGKDTLVSNPLLNPYFKKNLTKKEFKTSNGNLSFTKKQKQNFQFNGYVLLDLTQKKASAILNNYDSSFSAEVEEITKNLTENFSDWNVAPFSDFKFIKVPFSFKRYFQITKSFFSYGDIYTLNSDEIPPFNVLFIDTNVQEEETSNQYFSLGVKDYEKKNYEEAALNFEKSYIANRRNLQAYYNYAALSLIIGNQFKACETYEFLKDKGQKPAEKIFLEKCGK